MREISWALKKAAWIALAIFVLATPTFAQTTGGIRGRVSNAATSNPIDGVLVVATSDAAQGEQFGVSDAAGRFEIPQLPPGTYQVRFDLDGFRPQLVRNVRVELGRFTPVTLDLAPTDLQAEEIEIRDAPPSVDRSATDTRTEYTQEYMQRVPVARDYEAVLAQTPGASRDSRGTTVLGATSTENSYVVDGMNTTSVASGESGANMTTDFFDRIELQTAGYLPEFGRSTGGIYNLRLASGGNDTHGSVFFNLSPGFLRASADPVGGAEQAILTESNIGLQGDAGFTVGGAILRDRLWFFAGYNPQFTSWDRDRVIRQRVDADGDGQPDGFREVERQRVIRNILQHNLVGKLTLRLNDDHRLELSYFGQPGTDTNVGSLVGSPSYVNQGEDSGSHNLVLNYYGQLLDGRMQVEAFAGLHRNHVVTTGNLEDPLQLDSRTRSLTEFEPTACTEDPATPFLECPVQGFRSGGAGSWQDDLVSRYSVGIKFTNTFAGHRVRYGFDYERRVFESTRGFSGGYFEEFHPQYPAGHGLRQYFGTPDENIAGGAYLYGVDGNPNFQSTAVGNGYAVFLQDQWQINDYVAVNGGLRWDGENFLDSEGVAALSIMDMFAPRLGLSVDPSGTGRARIFANWGWFYESMPLTIGQRAFSREGSTFRYADAAGNYLCIREDGTQIPGGDPVRDNCTINAGFLGGGTTPVNNNNRGQYHQEVIFGGEYAITPDVVVGVTGAWRNIENVVEDISVDNGNTYIIANPGRNDCDLPESARDAVVAAGYCVDAEGNFDPNGTIFVAPQRTYLGGTVTLRKQYSDHWQALASYTLSRTSGNYPGLFSQDSGQLDPNLSAQFDLPHLLVNRTGNLPTDRTHVIKLSGSYDFGGVTPVLEGLNVGLSYTGQSGIPMSYLGSDWTVYGAREAFILPRGSAGRTPFTHQADLNLGYTMQLSHGGALNFNLNFFNLFNSQRATLEDQQYTVDRVRPLADGSAPVESVVVLTGAGEPLLDADGNPVAVTPNGNFRSATRRQDPFAIRFGMRLTF